MTGFGEAHCQDQDLAVVVEIRTVNNRYFKFNLRASDGYATLEGPLESLVREQIKRGTVSLSLRVDRLGASDLYTLDAAVLAAYREQLGELKTQWQIPVPVALESLLQLPGVVREAHRENNRAEHAWPVVQKAAREALSRLSSMRADEGRAMADDLRQNCRLMAAELERIAERAPFAVEAYRARLHERVGKALEEFNVTLNPSDLIREISIYADRTDISEEIVRLRSHLDQFETIVAAEDSAGRKLEFLIQEMLREVNTIGSKSNDVQVARHVIEMKTAIERLKEMIQNVE